MRNQRDELTTNKQASEKKNNYKNNILFKVSTNSI